MAIIQAQTREGLGKGASRFLRRQARIPAVLYGGTRQNRNLTLDRKELLKLLDTEGSGLRTHRQDMVIDGDIRVAVLLRDYQIHPVTGMPEHVDFMRFDPNQIIQVEVPIRVTDEEICVGIKAGGMLEMIQKDVEVQCRADDLPNFLEVSVAKLEIGDAIHVRDLQLPQGVHINAEDNFTLVTVVGVHGEPAEEAVAG
ncbi:MAG: 50S ribosomal protein L25/general stress protein Ctc [Magnetococcales bacterium]|nr:50S ribosomal protein L25/general stress protein Ctc [Magnetococcales bacterium]MBF0262832.1 50S ribosomal protein L25/general stress protein Ctc [Magnetococcales bacterium]